MANAWNAAADGRLRDNRTPAKNAPVGFDSKPKQGFDLAFRAHLPLSSLLETRAEPRGL
jgi:hypothetical protein